MTSTPAGHRELTIRCRKCRAHARLARMRATGELKRFCEWEYVEPGEDEPGVTEPLWIFYCPDPKCRPKNPNPPGKPRTTPYAIREAKIVASFNGLGWPADDYGEI